MCTYTCGEAVRERQRDLSRVLDNGTPYIYYT